MARAVMVGVPAVRVVPIVAIAAAVVALVAFSGTASASPKAAQACGGLPAYTSGPEVVFGRPGTLAAAQKLQAQVVGAGFTFTSIEMGCGEVRVVLRGYDTYATAVAIQAE